MKKLPMKKRDYSTSGESVNYIKSTAMFYLAIKQAIDNGKNVVHTKEDIY
ncbi:hypothetical protein OAL38_01080 [bacterium]|nr:hypothetical protein [bacterium]